MFLATTLAATVVLSLIHIFVGRLRFLDRHPSVWKSVSGGIAIAYMFLVLLPKLAGAQSALQAATDTGLYGFLEHHAYLVALLGLVIYYGMDAAVETTLAPSDRQPLNRATRVLVYAHACSLSGYYFLVSYLMSEIRDRGTAGYLSVGLFAVAMVMHYLTIDHGLRHKFGALYEPVLRWTFVAASVGGWTVAGLTEIPYNALALLNSLFAGALIVFTLKEKVPGSDRVHFWPFLAGAVGYSTLLLIVELLASADA